MYSQYFEKKKKRKKERKKKKAMQDRFSHNSNFARNSSEKDINKIIAICSQ